MKKILLISLDSKYIHTNLSLLYLKSFTNYMKDEIQVEILELTINDRLENCTEKIIEKNPDYVGFSTYIWNVEIIEKIENLIFLLDKKIEIFYGGPEVSYKSEEFLRKHKGNYIISGEGEKIFENFLKYILGDKKIENIKGMYYKNENGEIKFNGQEKLIDINDLVFPYNNYEFDTRIVYYESSRGCPFRCSYCLSSVTKTLRFLDVERVKKEIDFFIDKKIKLVKFVDRTFNANLKFAKEIWKYIANKSIETTFHFEISGDILDEDSIEILNSCKKGIIQLEVGVQTTNENVIKHIDRKTNIEKLRINIEKLMKNNNINIHLDLIAGLPEETLESFKKSFDDVYNMKSNELQLGFLKIIKGAPIEDQKEDFGIVNSPYSPYEVLKTNHISYSELLNLKKVEAVVDKYHNSKRFENTLKFFMNKSISPYEFFYELSEYLRKNNFFNRSVSQVDYYKILLDFNNEKYCESDKEILIDVIKYDYLKYNKKRWLPEFMNRYLSIDKEKKMKNQFIENEIIDKNNKNHIELYKYDVFNFNKKNMIEKLKNVIIYTYEEKEIQIFI